MGFRPWSKGYTEALRDGDLAPKRATFETMYQEAQHLSHLIDDLRMLSLVEAHGGSITVASAVGQGTTFEIVLP